MSRYLLVDMVVASNEDLEEFIGTVDQAMKEGWTLQGGVSVVQMDAEQEHYTQALYKEPSQQTQIFWRDKHTHVIYEDVKSSDNEGVAIVTTVQGNTFTVPFDQLERLEDDS